MPAMTRGFIVIEPELVPGGLEAVSNRPVMAFNGNEPLDVRPTGTTLPRSKAKMVVRLDLKSIALQARRGFIRHPRHHTPYLR